MKSKFTETIPRYQQIAIEIAARIVSGEVAEGERISGRSYIASRFNVSPETARRAFCVLSDLDIVSAEKGGGTRIKSRARAADFLARFSNHKNIESVKSEVFRCIEAQSAELERLRTSVSELVEATEHYRSTNPLAPFSVRLTSNCRFLGKTIENIRLWQNTGATLVAIKRGGELMLSPGPYAVLTENDDLYYIAQDLSPKRVSDYLMTPQEED